MESPAGPSNPLLSFSSFIHQHSLKLGSQLASRLDETRKFASKLASTFPSPPPPPAAATPTRNRLLPWNYSSSLPFASISQQQKRGSGKQGSEDSAVVAAADGGNKGLSSDQVAKTLAGTSVFTVSNSNNEFVLISDPDGAKSIGLLCFRQEDAQAFLAQVKSRKGEVRGGTKVVPITLDQVYMLKVEGIAFRFLPDPVQIKNALELKSSNIKSGFDGVPVFQSDLLIVKKKNKRYSPIYFRKEDIEKELSMTSRASRGAGVSQHIMVGSLEDVLKKMETNQKNSGWEDLIFIPPGKSHSQHINEVAKT